MSYDAPTRGKGTDVDDTIATRARGVGDGRSRARHAGGGSSNAAKILLAGIAGLVFVGLMLVLAAVVTKRRTGGVPSTSTDTKIGAKISP